MAQGGNVVGFPTDTANRILIVSGEAGLRSTLEMALAYNRDRYQVFTAPSGRSALLQLGIVKPTLIILDLSLPHEDGWETLRRIRALDGMPLIALCNQADQEAAVASLALGADYCLPRPVAILELQARVRALLRRAHPQERSGPRPA